VRPPAAKGVNVAIEAVGLPLTFRQAVEAVCFAGRVVYVGYAKKDVTYDTTSFVRKELDILGSRNALRVFPAVIKMLAGRQFPFTDLISATYPFTQAATALSDWNQNPGRFTKILIDINNNERRRGNISQKECALRTPNAAVRVNAPN
jgi:threonine dehydrogenase-like Zn-dependent dehydrogenase